jgi:hypothetical protein
VHQTSFPSPLLKALYRANLICAALYAGASILVSYTYTLYLPHAVGHLHSVASIAITAIWAIHCALLLAPHRRYAAPIDRWGPALVAGLGVASAVVSWVNYHVQSTA